MKKIKEERNRTGVGSRDGEHDVGKAELVDLGLEVLNEFGVEADQHRRVLPQLRIVDQLAELRGQVVP